MSVSETALINPDTADRNSHSSDRRGLMLELLARLDRQGYGFVAPTPSTHRRVVARPGRRYAKDIADILGWSLPARAGTIDKDIEARLVEAAVLERRPGGFLQPRLRVSRAEGLLFWHSAYPTDARDAVFLGPDSYRFAQLILARMDAGARSVLDYGAGSGVGGIVAARRAGAHLTIADINPKALFLASINAEHAGVGHRTIEVSRPADIGEKFDLIVTHPPFMIDADRRAYRDGGALYGAQLSLDWTCQCAAMLAPGGRFIMHTGVSIVRGEDLLFGALREKLPKGDLRLDYRELDPDIFGDELDKPAYAEVDRIAAVAAVIERSPR